VHDSRPKAKIPTEVFPAALFAMFCCRLPSFNELEQHRHKSSWTRWLGGHCLPSADELAYVSERLEPEGLRQCLGHIYSKLKRNKVLMPQRGWMLAAVDGHEVFSSYKRCCDTCLQRTITVRGEQKIQYYHRLVAFQILCEDFQLLLDVEMLEPGDCGEPGDDEVAAAMRLIARVLENHPRCFDVLTADALYLRPSVIKLLKENGKHLVAVLKANQPELLAEARTLLPLEEQQHQAQWQSAAIAPEQFDTPAAPGKPARHIVLHQAEGFRTETIDTELRVVHSHEIGTRRERIAGDWVETPIDSHWWWATTMPRSLAEGATIFHFGHDRWKIENEGFNELVTRWHSSHCFHHHPNSILVLWLILFMAHAVFHCFYKRNLKPELRRTHTGVYFAALIAGRMRENHWWPPPPD